MPINTSCTGCGQLLTVADQHASKQARCPSCGQIYTVPLRSTATATGEPLSEEQRQNFGSVQNPFFDFPKAELSPASTDQRSAFDSPILVTTTSSDTSANMFWMRSVDQVIYGPVDRATMDRWFREGRVGQGFTIRQGEHGLWQHAGQYLPSNQASPSTNPYASTPIAPMAPVGQSSNAAMILLFGILSWFICVGFGIAAIAMGRSALRDIDEGRGDPSQRTIVSIGFWLGIIHVVVFFCFLGMWLLLVALTAIGGGIR